MAVLFEKPFYSSTVFYHRDDDLAVGGSILLCNEQIISVEDPDIDHGISTHLQHKGLLIRQKVRRKWKIVGNILLRKDRFTCSDTTDHGDVGYLSSGEVEGVIHDLDGPGL